MQTDQHEQLIEELLDEISDTFTADQQQGLHDAIHCGEHDIALRTMQHTISEKQLVVDQKFNSILK